MSKRRSRPSVSYKAPPDVDETQDEIIERLRVKPSPSETINFRPQPPEVVYSSDVFCNDSKCPRRHKKQQVLNTSMKFVPLLNSTPHADAFESPYLFAVKGRPLRYIRKFYNRTPFGCIPRPQTRLSVEPDEEPYDTVILQWPEKPKALVKNVHQRLVLAYMDYYNKAREDNKLPDGSPVTYGLEPTPQEPIMVPKREEKYSPPEDYAGPVPFFPDLESLMGRFVVGIVHGYMDSEKKFHTAQMGDSLPNDAVIGYKNTAGVFHKVMSVAHGVTTGKIKVRRAHSESIGRLEWTMSQLLILAPTPQSTAVEESMSNTNEGEEMVKSRPSSREGSIPLETVEDSMNVEDQDEEEQTVDDTLENRRKSSSRSSDEFGAKLVLLKGTLGMTEDQVAQLVPPGALFGYVDQDGNFTETLKDDMDPDAQRAYLVP